jgi:hypothetical protein
MKTLNVKMIIVGTLISLFSISAISQPIPLSFTAGHRYMNIGMTLSKNFSDSSKFGFFHMSTSDIYYTSKENNDLIMQNLLFFAPWKSFRITGGVFYGKPGFLGTAGFQFIKKYKSWFVLIAPLTN